MSAPQTTTASIDFDAMTYAEFEAHPDSPAKQEYIAEQYRAALREHDLRRD